MGYLLRCLQRVSYRMDGKAVATMLEVSTILGWHGFFEGLYEGSLIAVCLGAYTGAQSRARLSSRSDILEALSLSTHLSRSFGEEGAGLCSGYVFLLPPYLGVHSKEEPGASARRVASS
jgi:hypothetical protein